MRTNNQAQVHATSIIHKHKFWPNFCLQHKFQIANFKYFLTYFCITKRKRNIEDLTYILSLISTHYSNYRLIKDEMFDKWRVFNPKSNHTKPIISLIWFHYIALLNSININQQIRSDNNKYKSKMKRKFNESLLVILITGSATIYFIH